MAGGQVNWRKLKLLEEQGGSGGMGSASPPTPGGSGGSLGGASGGGSLGGANGTDDGGLIRRLQLRRRLGLKKGPKTAPPVALLGPIHRAK